MMRVLLHSPLDEESLVRFVLCFSMVQRAACIRVYSGAMMIVLMIRIIRE